MPLVKQCPLYQCLPLIKILSPPTFGLLDTANKKKCLWNLFFVMLATMLKHYTTIITLPPRLQDRTRLTMRMSVLPPQQTAPLYLHPVEPSMSFIALTCMFENYIFADNQEDSATTRKHALLIHCLRKESQRIFIPCQQQVTFMIQLSPH